MNKNALIIATAAAVTVAACGDNKTAGKLAPEPAATAVAAVRTDPELEQLKSVKPVEACALLSQDKLKAAFPDLKFEVHQKLDAQMSGYSWDSRCTYWAGVGTVAYAKDVPTHTIELFVNTVASVEKANARLASRAETATTSTGYRPQPTMGPNAYSTSNTGIASLFFVKGQSEVQLGFSDLNTPVEEKIKKLIALAKSL